MTLLGPIFSNDPDALAFRVGRKDIGYRQFCQDIDTMAWWFRDNGIGADKAVGIGSMGGHHYWTWIAHLAAIRIGARHATIASRGNLLAALGADGKGLDAFFVAGEQPAALPPTLRPLVIAAAGLDPLAAQLGVEPRVWEDGEAERSASRLALTSGTTGRWRACLWTHATMSDRIDQAARGAEISSGTLLCPAIGLLTTAGFRFPIAAWRAGGAMLGWEERDVVPTTSPQIVESCSLLVASPVNLQSLLNRLPEPWQGRDSRTTIVVGARLAGQLRDRALQRACARIDIAYGSTEAGRIAIGDAALVDRHPGAVGFVSDGATVEIVDAQDRSLPPGQEGIVRLRAPAMCNGYERSRATRMRSPFRNGWFYPGDEGIMFDDGLLAITGREGETVNVGGHKLSLPTLENRLSAVRGVADVCVVPVALSQGDIVAIVAVLGGHSNLTPLRNIARGLLPRRCPFRIVAVPRIPRNQAGKLDRGKLSRQLAAQL